MPRQIPLHMKAAIITLHLFTDKSWNDISAALRVHPESARQIFQRAKERVGGSEDPLVILAGLANQKPIGRPKGKRTKRKEERSVAPPSEFAQA